MLGDSRDDSGAFKRSFLIAYGSGSIGTAAFFVVPQLFLLYVSTEYLGIPAAWASVALFFPRIWEFFIDPVIGRVSDGWSGRWGRRRPFLIIGSLAFAVTFIALFSPPNFDSWVLDFIYLFATYFLCTTAFAIFAVPYLTVPAEIAKNKDERTRIVSYRMAGSSIGLVVAGVAGPILVSAFGDTLSAYGKMAFGLTIPFLACMLLPAWALAGVPEQPVAKAGFKLSEAKDVVLRNRKYLALTGVFMAQTVASGASLALLPYFNTYSLKQETSHMSVLYILITVGMLCGLPLWTRCAVWTGKTNSYVLALLAYTLGCMALVLTPDAGAAVYGFVFMLIGFALGGTQLIAFSLFPDTLLEDGSGQKYEGLFTGVWISIDSLGVALGVASAGTFLAISSYDASRDVQTLALGTEILIASSVGVGLIALLATLLAVRFRCYPGRTGDDATPQTG